VTPQSRRSSVIGYGVIGSGDRYRLPIARATRVQIKKFATITIQLLHPAPAVTISVMSPEKSNQPRT
jgi:hypothetical protein